jgi:NADH-quinone oxidoreductase subunit H
LADALKLLTKELLIPSHANSFIFFAAPLCILSISLLTWSVVPLNNPLSVPVFQMPTLLSDARQVYAFYPSLTSYGILVLLALSSLNVYGIIIAGWSSNSKYAFLGALRSAAQMISYEVSISLILLPVIALSKSISLPKIALAQAQAG